MHSDLQSIFTRWPEGSFTRVNQILLLPDWPSPGFPGAGRRMQVPHPGAQSFVIWRPCLFCFLHGKALECSFLCSLHTWLPLVLHSQLLGHFLREAFPDYLILSNSPATIMSTLAFSAIFHYIPTPATEFFIIKQGPHLCQYTGQCLTHGKGGLKKKWHSLPRASTGGVFFKAPAPSLVRNDCLHVTDQETRP